MENENNFSADTFWKDFIYYKSDFIPENFSVEKIDVFESIDSTNAELLRRVQNQPIFFDCEKLTAVGKKFDKMLVASCSQSAGRGRIGRAFYSPDKTGIYFSLIHVPPKKEFDPGMLTAASAVAISRAIENVFSVKTKIKWVNDVYVDEKKVCGILAEGFCSNTGKIQGVVIGIGINIAMEKSNDENLSKAGGIIDLASCNNPSQFRSKLLAACVKELFFIFERNENFISEYREKSILTGKTVKVTPLVGTETGSYFAKVLDITDNAGLLVQLEDGSKKELSTGEVSLHE